MMIQSAVAPILKFETRSRQDNTLSMETGRPTFVDVDFLIISPPGTRDTFEAEAVTWLKEKRKAAALGNYPLDWIEKFEEGYKRWKAGSELPESGWAIRMCPSFSPAEVSACTAIDIKTVEELAQVPDTGLNMLGLNGRIIRDKARNLIEVAANTAGAATKMAAMSADIETMKSSIKARDEKIAELEAALRDKNKKGT